MHSENIKMDTTNMPSEIKEAWKISAEINDLLGEVIQWASNEADAAITKLHGKWQELCSNTETARSKKFCDECMKILAECESFRAKVVEKSQFFAENTKDKVSIIKEMTRDNKETKSLLKDILKLWNVVEQPQLVLLFEKTAALESSIMDMVEFGIQPI